MPIDPPTGTVTFLFTDIEGSTKLWEDRPADMRTWLREHDALLAGILALRGGYVFKTVGDAFCAAFARAPDALAAAADIQAGMAALNGRGSPLRIRIGLHAGAAEERDGDYFGPAVNRVARLMSAGHGGQVILSAAVQELVRDELPPGARLVDLGCRRLKDLSRAEQVWQLSIPGLPSEFPPLRTIDARPNNLPVQTTSFVGRSKERDEVLPLLRNSRMLTILGAGGTGKTRLAVELAAELLDSRDDGVWFVDLAPVTADADPAVAVAAAMSLRLEQDVPPLDALASYLASRSLLVVIDNCEHMIASCARLADAVLRRCPGVGILATSREPLGIAGETTWTLSPLGVPDRGERDPGRLATFDAVRLFIERASAAKPGFAVDNANAPDVAEICARLDGIPLAIELATARLRSMTVRAVRERLDDRFRLLTSGSRTALPRQQTLEALITWSWDLLDEPERLAFAALSAFRSPFTVNDAIAIAGDDCLDIVPHLADKSLLVAEEGDDGMTVYRMLESLREFAGRKLEESGRAGEIRSAHLAYFESMARGIRDGTEVLRSAEPLDRARRRLPDILAATDFALAEPGLLDDAARIASYLCRAAMYRWMMTELAPGIVRVYDRRDEIQDTGLRAAIIWARGVARRFQGDLDAALADYKTAQASFRDIGDAAGEATALLDEMDLLVDLDAIQLSVARFEEAAAVARASGSKRLLAEIYLCAANYHVTMDADTAHARAALETAIAAARACGDLVDLAGCHMSLARTALRENDPDAALAECAKVEESLVPLADPELEATALFLRGEVERRMGRHDESIESGRRVLALRARCASVNEVAWSMYCLSLSYAAAGRRGEADAIITEAIGMLRDAGKQDFAFGYMFTQVLALADRGDLALARTAAHALCLDAASRGSEEDMSTAERIVGRVCLAAGDMRGAEEAFVEASRHRCAGSFKELTDLFLAICRYGNDPSGSVRAAAEALRNYIGTGNRPLKTIICIAVLAMDEAARGDAELAWLAASSLVQHWWLQYHGEEMVNYPDLRAVLVRLMNSLGPVIPEQRRRELDAEAKARGPIEVARELLACYDAAVAPGA